MVSKWTYKKQEKQESWMLNRNWIWPGKKTTNMKCLMFIIAHLGEWWKYLLCAWTKFCFEFLTESISNGYMYAGLIELWSYSKAIPFNWKECLPNSQEIAAKAEFLAFLLFIKEKKKRKCFEGLPIWFVFTTEKRLSWSFTC